MKIDVTGRKVDISDALRTHIDKKVSKLDRFLPRILDAKVELDHEETKSKGQRFVARVIVKAKRNIFTAEERSEDVFVAIDRVSEALYKQLEHYKGKHFERKKGKPTIRQIAPEGQPQEPDAIVGGKLVKIKKFEVRPMSLAEASQQMEQLEHEFFIFINQESGDVNLLYKRKDGNLGLIEPELA